MAAKCTYVKCSQVNGFEMNQIDLFCDLCVLCIQNAKPFSLNILTALYILLINIVYDSVFNIIYDCKC